MRDSFFVSFAVSLAHMELPDPYLKSTLKLAEQALKEFCQQQAADSFSSADQRFNSFMAVLLETIELGEAASLSHSGPFSELCLMLHAGVHLPDPCPALLAIGHINEHLRSCGRSGSQDTAAIAEPTVSTGRVYTPLWLVREMLAELLSDWEPAPAGDTTDNIHFPRLLDPACGCGAFLLGAAQEMLERCMQAQEPKLRGSHFPDDSITPLRRRIVEQFLNGCDTDAQALALCAALLSFWVCGSFNDASLHLQLRLRHADALSGPAPGMPGSIATEPAGLDWQTDPVLGLERGAFDYILGNPPYIDSESMSRNTREFRDFARRSYRTARGNWDIYVLFFERCLALLKPGGRLSLVVPARSICAEYAAELQQLLLENVPERFRLLEPDLFPAARIWPVVIQVRHSDSPAEQQPVRIQQGLDAREHLVAPALLQRLPAGYLAAAFSEASGYIAELLERAPALGSFALCCDGCSTSEAYRLVGLISDGCSRSDAYRLVGLVNDGAEEAGFKLLNTGTIDPYTSHWGQKECRYLGKRYRHPWIDSADLTDMLPRRAAQAASPKLLLAGLSARMECFVDSDGSYSCGKAAVQLLPLTPDLDLHFLCGLLNSRLLNWIYRSLFGLRGYSRRAMNIGPRQLELLPIISWSAGAVITALSQQLSMLEPGTDVLKDPRQSELDESVFAMYGVDKKLRGIIESEMKF